jgi:hypothetical protein
MGDGIKGTKLNRATDVSLDAIIKVLSAKSPKKEQVAQARIASSVLSTAVRYESMRNARAGLALRVASAVLTDPAEKRRYLLASVPDLKLLS